MDRNELSNHGFPNTYFQWKVVDDGKYLEWDGGEKFYDYDLLLDVIVNKIVEWGGEISGKMTYQGERNGDCGVLLIKDDAVYKIPVDKLTFPLDAFNVKWVPDAK